MLVKSTRKPGNQEILYHVPVPAIWFCWFPGNPTVQVLIVNLHNLHTQFKMMSTTHTQRGSVVPRSVKRGKSIIFPKNLYKNDTIYGKFRKNSPPPAVKYLKNSPPAAKIERNRPKNKIFGNLYYHATRRYFQGSRHASSVLERGSVVAACQDTQVFTVGSGSTRATRITRKFPGKRPGKLPAPAVDFSW